MAVIMTRPAVLMSDWTWVAEPALHPWQEKHTKWLHSWSWNTQLFLPKCRSVIPPEYSSSYKVTDLRLLFLHIRHVYAGQMIYFDLCKPSWLVSHVLYVTLSALPGLSSSSMWHLIPLPVPHLYPTFTRFLCQPHPSNFTPFSPWPANPSFPQPRSSYPGLGSPCPCLSSSLPSPLLCLPQPQPSAQRSRGEPARNAVALDVLSKP